jgi:hypothetical protein
MLKTLSLLSLLLFSLSGFAIEKPPEADALNEDDSSYVDESDVIELDRMTVTGEKMPLKKETRLRIVRHAMNEPRSSKPEDKDKMLCWLETPVGTRLQKVTCARNGDMDALRTGGKDGQIGGDAGYGRKYFWRSLHSDTEAGIRAIMASMPQDSYFDQEFARIASNGGQPPRDVPDEEELHKFAKAYIQVEGLTGQGRPEGEVVAAIKDSGFSLKRYNRMVELTGTYPIIREKVTEFVIEEKSPKS